MIGSKYDIELDGVSYRISSVGDGGGLRESSQPIRAPNAQTVIGDDTTKLNIRQDVLVWRWTDWSLGEGYFKLDPQNPRGYFDGSQIDGYSIPGTLRLGFYAANPDDTAWSGTAAYEHLVSFYSGGGDVLYQVSGTTIYVWPVLSSGTSITGATSGIVSTTADNEHIYMKDANSIIRWDQSTFEDFATGLASGGVIRSVGFSIVELDADQTDSLVVTEYDKTASVPVSGTTLYAPGGATHSGTTLNRLTTSSYNRVYTVTQDQVATIHEIVPSSAAGAGYGKPIGTVPARILALEWAAGLLYMVTLERAPAGEFNIVLGYFDPINLTYGSIGVLEDVDYHTRGFMFSRGEGMTNFLLFAKNAADDRVVVYVIDIVAGAFHQVGVSGNATDVTGPIFAAGRLGNFFAAIEGDDGYSCGWTSDGYAGGSTNDDPAPYIESSLWDFGIVDPKILSSIRIETESIPANWTVTVKYDTDESGTFTTAGTLTAGDTGATFNVSTGASSTQFRTLRLRLEFVSTDATPTDAPVVHNVEARAQLVERVKVWDVRVDLSDDHSASGPKRGDQKAVNIQDAADQEKVISFKNGFYSAQPDTFQEHNVVLDAYNIEWQRPGEGTAVLRLVERA